MASFQTGRMGERMLSVEEAQQRVMDEVRVNESEPVALVDALGRVLREDVISRYDVPQADNTAMDGYAVRAADIAGAKAGSPVALKVIEDLPAGSVATRICEFGTAIRIMTGALIPEGADTVAHVEITDAGSDEVKIFNALKVGTNIRRMAEDMRSGDVVLKSGSVIGAAEAGVLAGVQKSLVTVARRPTVAILSTGDELIEIDGTLTPGKVVNSNSYSLSALVHETGAVPRVLGTVADDLDATVAAIESALESDFIISSGGVSVGAYDFVKDALDRLGAETMFWQVAMKPGKPVVLSRLGDRLYFGLPGNPVSCMVSFILFIAPAIRKSMGQSEDLFPATVMVRCEGTLSSRGDRRSYLRVRVSARDGALVSTPMKSQGSGVSTSMVKANGFAIVEAGVTTIEPGTKVPTVIFGPIHTG
ncbi:MAG TPA: gephyrin-like molybdotransferase Glp [Thermoanaerobaculia bacterium]|nr:gephyrin-like molybdotransferase Glp [Thermoanaerobaculia bacterium]